MGKGVKIIYSEAGFDKVIVKQPGGYMHLSSHGCISFTNILLPGARLSRIDGPAELAPKGTATFLEWGKPKHSGPTMLSTHVGNLVVANDARYKIARPILDGFPPDLPALSCFAHHLPLSHGAVKFATLTISINSGTIYSHAEDKWVKVSDEGEIEIRQNGNMHSKEIPAYADVWGNYQYFFEGKSCSKHLWDSMKQREVNEAIGKRKNQLL